MHSDRHNYYCPVHIVAEPGAARHLPVHLQKLNLVNPLVVVDHGLRSSEAFLLVQKAWESHSFDPKLLSWQHSHPNSENIDEAYLQLSGPHDGVVALGGGSTIDAAKALAVMLGQQHPHVADFLRPSSRPFHDPLPLLVFPSTMGSGSEVTRGVVIHNVGQGSRQGFGGGHIYPKMAFLDVELVKNIPFSVLANSVFDAFSHALESYLARRLGLFSEVFALKSIEMLVSNFTPDLLRDNEGYDLHKLQHLMEASTLAGLSFSSGISSTHLGHGIGEALHLQYGVPHGQSSAVVLPAMLASLAPHYPDRLPGLLRAFGLDPQRHQLADALAVLRACLAFGGLPALRTLAPEGDLKHIANATHVNDHAPMGWTQEEVQEILHHAYQETS